MTKSFFGWCDQILPHLLFCFPKNHAAPSQSCWKHTHMPLWWFFCLPIFPRLKSKSMFRIWLSISKYSEVKGKRGSQILPFHHLCFIPEQKHAEPSRNQKCQKQHFKKKRQQKHLVVDYKHLVVDYRKTWMHDPLPMPTNIMHSQWFVFCQSQAPWWRIPWVVVLEVDLDLVFWKSWRTRIPRFHCWKLGKIAVKKSKKNSKPWVCWRKIPFFFGRYEGSNSWCVTRAPVFLGGYFVVGFVLTK